MIACQLLFSKSTFLYISPLFPFSLNMLFSIYAFLYKCLLPAYTVDGYILFYPQTVAENDTMRYYVPLTGSVLY